MKYLIVILVFLTSAFAFATTLKCKFEGLDPDKQLHQGAFAIGPNHAEYTVCTDTEDGSKKYNFYLDGVAFGVGYFASKSFEIGCLADDPAGSFGGFYLKIGGDFLSLGPNVFVGSGGVCSFAMLDDRGLGVVLSGSGFSLTPTNN
jgi:hypothetical protein